MQHEKVSIHFNGHCCHYPCPLGGKAIILKALAGMVTNWSSTIGETWSRVADEVHQRNRCPSPIWNLWFQSNYRTKIYRRDNLTILPFPVNTISKHVVEHLLEKLDHSQIKGLEDIAFKSIIWSPKSILHSYFGEFRHCSQHWIGQTVPKHWVTRRPEYKTLLWWLMESARSSRAKCFRL